MNFITDFADQAVLLPLVATVTLVLLLQRRWRLAGAWATAIVCVLGTLLVLKLATFACGWRVPLLGPGGIDLRSPSGHTGAAAVTFGGLAGLAAARSRFGVRMAVVIAAAAAGLVIGITRVLLGAHSVAEVVLAFGIGMAGAGLFAWLAGRETNAPLGVAGAGGQHHRRHFCPWRASTGGTGAARHLGGDRPPLGRLLRAGRKSGGNAEELSPGNAISPAQSIRQDKVRLIAAMLVAYRIPGIETE